MAGNVKSEIEIPKSKFRNRNSEIEIPKSEIKILDGYRCFNEVG